jgi:hypothetical protein
LNATGSTTLPLDATRTDPIARLRHDRYAYAAICHPEPVEGSLPYPVGARFHPPTFSSDRRVYKLDLFERPSARINCHKRAQSRRYAVLGKAQRTMRSVHSFAAIDAECRLYDRLFTAAEPDADGDFKKNINLHSLEFVICKAELRLQSATADARYQFERLGYFALDADTTPDKFIFNRTITLKDTWAKEVKKQG